MCTGFRNKYCTLNHYSDCKKIWFVGSILWSNVALKQWFTSTPDNMYCENFGQFSKRNSLEFVFVEVVGCRP